MTIVSESQSEFQHLLSRICAGSDEAVWDFIEHYGPHIRKVIQRRMHQRLRIRFDSGDFLQMVWASFFANPDTLRRFREPVDVLRYLDAVARNKVVSESRKGLRQRRDMTREESLDEEGTAAPQHSNPVEIAIARERWQSLMRDDEKRRQIMELRLAGETYQAIAEQVGLHERTVRRIIRELAESVADH